MVNLPLSQEKMRTEIENIVEIGRVNGYDRTTITRIIKKHQDKKALSNFSTFYESTTSDYPVKRIGVKYFPSITKLLKPIYKRHGLEVVHRNDGSLKNALGSIKDVPPDIHKSGIYRIQCSNCGRYYFGMSVRA